MWGAIIGDIIGSSFENANHRSPFFELFRKDALFTDDTVCTAAVADILFKLTEENLTSNNISDELRLWCCTYLNRGFGSMFYQWIANAVNKPYGSYGNGALMRISPVAMYAIKNNWSREKALEVATLITNTTHNHPQAINAVNCYINILYELLLYKKENKTLMNIDAAKFVVANQLIAHNYSMPKSIEEYRTTIEFDLTCNTSLSVACAGIFAAENFEDVMYQVVSVGGDSDTYAAIAGAMAEAIFGLNENVLGGIEPYFKPFDRDIILVMSRLYEENSQLQ